MKKLLASLLCLCLMLGMTACGSNSPAANTAPPDTQSSQPSGGGGKEPSGTAHEPYHISIAGGRSGDTWFVLSHALATFINERSDWLTAEVVTTAGIADDVRLVAGDETMWDNYLVCTMVPGNDIWGEGKYLPKLIATMCFQSDCLVTLDPNLKLEDLAGKNIALPRDTPYGNGRVFRNFLEIFGIENYNDLPGGNGDRLTALQDGAADAGVLVPDFYYPTTFVMGSGMLELSSRGTLYFPMQGRTDELLPLMTQACKSGDFVGEYELPAMVAIAPAGAFGDGQTEAVPFFAWPIYLAASDDVPDDVIKEVCRIYYEAAEKGEFADYHAVGVGITPEFAAFSPWEVGAQRDKFYHQAALEFYESVGQEIKCFSDLQEGLLNN